MIIRTLQRQSLVLCCSSILRNSSGVRILHHRIIDIYRLLTNGVLHHSVIQSTNLHNLTMAKLQAKPFKVALVQLGGLTDNKAHNLQLAAEGVKEAVSKGKADVVVLPVGIQS